MLDCGKRDVHLRSSQQPIAQSQTVRLHHLRRVAMARAQASKHGLMRLQFASELVDTPTGQERKVQLELELASE